MSEQAERRLLEVLIQHPEHLQAGELKVLSRGGLMIPIFQAVLAVMLTEDLTAEDLAARLMNQLPDEAGLIEELNAAPLPVLFETDLPGYCRGVITISIARALERQKAAWLGLLRLEINPKRQLKYQKRIVKLEQRIYSAKWPANE